MIVLTLLVSACRRQTAQGPASAPTATATPRSTPLPPVATQVPVGAEGNALRIVVFPSSRASNMSAFASTVEEALAEATGLSIEIVLADSYAETLAAICGSTGGDTVAAAWVDGLGYAAAAAAECGTAALQIERGTGRNARTGEVVQVIVKSDANITTAADLVEKRFCRIDYTDRYSWLVPLVLLRADGIVPLQDLGEIVDHADATELLEATIAGDCDAIGLTEADYEEFTDADMRQELTILTQSPEIPYSILVYPFAAPLGLQQSINDALIEIATGSGDSTEALKELLDYEALIPVEDADFTQLRAFANSSGLDFAQIDD